MATVDQLLAVAESQLGVGETPPGSNATPYSVWYGLIGPWCAMYCLWCAAQVGLKLPTHSAYVPTMYSQMVSADLWIPASEAGPGDFCMFNFDGGLLDHVGIVTDRLGSNAWATIEGNTDDVVRHHVRSPAYGYQMVFCRPAYDQPEPPKPKPREDEMAVIQYLNVTKAFLFDCYRDRYNYFVTTDGVTENLVFTLVEHETGVTHATLGQPNPPQGKAGPHDHNIQDILAQFPDIKKSFRLDVTCASPINISIREVPR